MATFLKYSNYSAYSIAACMRRRPCSLGNGTRVSFAGWSWQRTGSYTGSNINATVEHVRQHDGNRVWNIQYYVNVNSTYGTYGSGWYNANSTAIASCKLADRLWQRHARGLCRMEQRDNANSTKMHVSGPMTIDALWTTQYRIGATTPYGGVQGTGWYDPEQHGNPAAEPNSRAGKPRDAAWILWMEQRLYEQHGKLCGERAADPYPRCSGRSILLTLVPENIFGNAVSECRLLRHKRGEHAQQQPLPVRKRKLHCRLRLLQRGKDAAELSVCGEDAGDHEA